jgi:flagellar biosynthetic protein FliR
MHGELTLDTATLLGFLVTLARVAGVFIFVPLPGMRTAMDVARVVLSLGVTMALFPVWPHVTGEVSIGLICVWMISEAALGLGIGLAVAFVTEAIGVSAQVMGLQAGYAYASTIDPNTQADSGILLILAQLAAGLVFFASGMDRQVLMIFAGSLETIPPGTFMLSRGAVEHVLSAGGIMLSTGIRLALPVVAVLLMVDLSLALLGRVNAQLQLLTIAFPIKMMLALTVLGWVLLLLPAIMRSDSAITFGVARSMVTR